MKKNIQPPRPRGQSGMVLIEAMFAAAILAMALLGAASVQVNSMRQSVAVNLQTQADGLARQMVERMRGNPAGLASGSYNAVSVNASTTFVSGSCRTGSTPCSSGSAIATDDIADWQNAVKAGLPSATGTVTGSGSGSQYTVTLTWLDNSTGATRTLAVATQLP